MGAHISASFLAQVVLCDSGLVCCILASASAWFGVGLAALRYPVACIHSIGEATHQRYVLIQSIHCTHNTFFPFFVMVLL